MPLGAWFMAQFLDLFPDDGTRRAATRLVGLGVVAAVPTALTGWAEWARADRGARRVGIVHATANAVGTLIFIGSWAARSHSRHDLGVRLGRLGGLVLLVGSLLGGYMRSDRQAVPDTGQAIEPKAKPGKRLQMYGVITTVPAPVEMYDGMHARDDAAGRHGRRRFAGACRAGHPRRLRGVGSVEVQGGLRPRQHRDRRSR